MHGERSCNGDTTHTAALEGSGSHQTKMPNKATYALVCWLPPQRALEPRVPRGDPPYVSAPCRQQKTRSCIRDGRRVSSP